MLYIGSDHAGFKEKELLKTWLEQKSIPFKDLGAVKFDPKDDYPDYAKKVAKAVVKSPKNRGILVCGSGFGMAIAANKVKGARAVAAYDNYTAKMSRQDDDANILTLRGRGFPQKKIYGIVDVWLKTSFSKEARHHRRVRKIEGRL
ncbi:RpiB/LacA/LacB family sugar-phosphate isomerase [Candidatus Woesearchaeota archaeon]|nr:RpiB/LacA/LacB family sugar-phosphate isomerase [Candidatus Woesearchaeota archaeon]